MLFSLLMNEFDAIIVSMIEGLLKRFLWGCVFICCGCSSLGGVDKAYSQINVTDGINMGEASIVAQKELQNSQQHNAYKIDSPDVLRNLLVKKHPDYWFVSFEPKSHKMTFWRYLIVINKKSGDIIHSDAYIPLEIVDYSWVLK